MMSEKDFSRREKLKKYDIRIRKLESEIWSKRIIVVTGVAFIIIIGLTLLTGFGR